MKKAIAILCAVILILSLTGCGDSAINAVKKYLDSYNLLNDDVMSDMYEIADRENLSNDDRETYINIFKRQYSDLKYEIIKEEYDGDEAVISAKITVYDLYKAQRDSSNYLAAHIDEFNDENGEYDTQKFIKYKLEQMKNMNDVIDYTIDFYVIKTDKGWTISSLSNSDLEKIHGIYNYEG